MNVITDTVNWWKLTELTEFWWEQDDLPIEKGKEFFCTVESPESATYIDPIIGIKLWRSDIEGKDSQATWFAYRGDNSAHSFTNYGRAFPQYDNDENGNECWGVPFYVVKKQVSDIREIHQRWFRKGLIDLNGFKTF